VWLIWQFYVLREASGLYLLLTLLLILAIILVYLYSIYLLNIYLIFIIFLVDRIQELAAGADLVSAHYKPESRIKSYLVSREELVSWLIIYFTLKNHLL